MGNTFPVDSREPPDWERNAASTVPSFNRPESVTYASGCTRETLASGIGIALLPDFRFNLYGATSAGLPFQMANDFVLTADGSRSAKVVDWLPVLLWGMLIFTMSTSTFSALNTSRFIEPTLRWLFPLASSATITVLHALVRKAAHFTEYGVLFWLLLRGPMQGRPYLALTVCVLYALLDEGHQVFVDGRTPSFYDVALDSTGALFSRFLNLAIAELA